MVGAKNRTTIVAHAHLIGVSDAAHGCGRTSIADLDAFDGIDAHEGRRQVAIKLGINRRTDSGWHAFGNDLDHRTAGRAGLAHAVEILLEELRLFRVRTEEGVLAHLVPVPARAIDLVRPHLNERAAHDQPGYDLSRNRAGADTRRGLPGGSPSAAPVVVNAVFDVIS